MVIAVPTACSVLAEGFAHRHNDLHIQNGPAKPPLVVWLLQLMSGGDDKYWLIAGCRHRACAIASGKRRPAGGANHGGESSRQLGGQAAWPAARDPQ